MESGSESIFFIQLKIFLLTEYFVESISSPFEALKIATDIGIMVRLSMFCGRSATAIDRTLLLESRSFCECAQKPKKATNDIQSRNLTIKYKNTLKASKQLFLPSCCQSIANNTKNQQGMVRQIKFNKRHFYEKSAWFTLKPCARTKLNLKIYQNVIVLLASLLPDPLFTLMFTRVLPFLTLMVD